MILRYLKMAGNILLYFIIYFATQLLTGFVFGAVAVSFIIAKYGQANIGKYTARLANDYNYILAAVSAVVSFAFFILLFKNKEKNLFERCKFKKIKINSVVKIIMASVGIVFICAAFISLTQGIFKDYNQVSNQISANEKSIPGLISAVLIIPFFEEVLFRGIIFNELRKNLNLAASIIIQALIFAVAHGNIAQGIYTFFLGIAAALVYTWTESILANATLHITFNLFGSVVVPALSVYIDNCLKGQIIGEYVVIGIYFVMGTIASIYSLTSLYKRCNLKKVDS